MSDLISRNEVLTYLNNLHYAVAGNRDISAWTVIGDAKKVIYDMPSAEPQYQWISCSERLPEGDGFMLVTYIDNRQDAVDMWIGWHEMENVWYIYGEQHCEELGNEVIAWMPLPEPYARDMRGEE